MPFFPGNSGFPTLQIDNIGVFSLLDVLLLPLKENIIFPAFCGKYKRKNIFLYNLLSSIFLGPYTVKYFFLYQNFRYCLDLLFVKF